MPDRNSVAFWKDVAHVYKDHPAVIFDLYNEPHDVTWDVWQHGGKVTEKGKDGQKREFEAVGMQAMLDAVRGTGAKNVVIVGGLDWAYDLSGFLEGYRLDDRRRQRDHLRESRLSLQGRPRRALARQDGGGHEDAARDRQRVRPAGTKDEPWLRRVLQALEDHQWDWTAWDMHPAAEPVPDQGLEIYPHAVLRPMGQAGPGGQRCPARRRPSDSAPRCSPPAGPRPTGRSADFDGHQDIGDVRNPGSVAFDKDAGTYAVAGSGANMWQARDAFHYAWKRVDQSTARWLGRCRVRRPGKEPHRKACLIFRQDLDADSAYVDAAIHGDGLTSLQFRDFKGDLTHEVQANVSAPGRLRLEKREDYVRLFVDAGDGSKFSGAAVRIELREPFYVGIGVCSHNADLTEKAVFSNVELAGRSPDGISPSSIARSRRWRSPRRIAAWCTSSRRGSRRPTGCTTASR